MRKACNNKLKQALTADKKHKLRKFHDLVLKKQEFKDDEISIFDETHAYRRLENRQFCMWLRNKTNTHVKHTFAQ